MSDLSASLYVYTAAPTALHARAHGSACSRCHGEGGWRYVYCTACRQYVNGRFAAITHHEEMQGRRPSIVTECGHEAFSLPGQVTCPDCDGSGLAQRQAA